MTDSFPRQQARTQGFSLGAPRSFEISPDGSRVAFLRSQGGDDPVTCLWVLDTGTGTERLVADPAKAGTPAAAMTDAERAIRERTRERAAGITGFATDAFVINTAPTNGTAGFANGLGGGTFSLAKVGNGVLTLQTNTCIGDTVGLILVSGSIVNLDFTGGPDVIASLVVDGVSQPPGIYGGPTSGAPHILPEFAGSGTVHVLTSTLVNISTRAFVQTGDNVMIGGFIVEGPYYKQVVIRALGPELTHYGVPNALANPTLELHDATGALIASNDNWMTTVIGGIIMDDQVDWIRSSGHAPTDPRESAIIAVLPPGNYTAIVRGVNSTVGVALVEVYDLIGV